MFTGAMTQTFPHRLVFQVSIVEGNALLPVLWLKVCRLCSTVFITKTFSLLSNKWMKETRISSVLV